MTAAIYDPQGKAQDIFKYVDDHTQPDAVTVAGGGEIEMEESLGEGPYTFEYTPDEDGSAVQTSQVGYDSTESGLEAETVQGALDRLSSIKVDVGQVNNPTLLDNGDFRKPINQRGQMEYTGAGYTIDRWVAVGAKIEIKSEGIVFTHTAGNYGDFKQYLENANLLMGKQCTISALIGGNLFSKTFQMGTIGTLAQIDFAENLHFFSVESSPCIFRLYSNNSVQIQAVKLERGPVQMLVHKEGDTWVLNDPPPDPALELAKCQPPSPQEQLRADVDFLAAMQGVSL